MESAAEPPQICASSFCKGIVNVTRDEQLKRLRRTFTTSQFVLLGDCYGRVARRRQRGGSPCLAGLTCFGFPAHDKFLLQEPQIEAGGQHEKAQDAQGKAKSHDYPLLTLAAKFRRLYKHESLVNKSYRR